MFDEIGGGNSTLSVDVEFYLEEILLKTADEADHEVDDEVFVVLLEDFACDQQSDIVVLRRSENTLIAFRRMI